MGSHLVVGSDNRYFLEAQEGSLGSIALCCRSAKLG